MTLDKNGEGLIASISFCVMAGDSFTLRLDTSTSSGITTPIADAITIVSDNTYIVPSPASIPWEANRIYNVPIVTHVTSEQTQDEKISLTISGYSDPFKFIVLYSEQATIVVPEAQS